MYDKDHPSNSLLRCFKQNELITSLNYGPFDNGHILIGFSTGDIIGASTVDLKDIFSLKIFDQSPVTSMTIEPTNMIFVGSD